MTSRKSRYPAPPRREMNSELQGKYCTVIKFQQTQQGKYIQFVKIHQIKLQIKNFCGPDERQIHEFPHIRRPLGCGCLAKGGNEFHCINTITKHYKGSVKQNIICLWVTQTLHLIPAILCNRKNRLTPFSLAL